MSKKLPPKSGLDDSEIVEVLEMEIKRILLESKQSMTRDHVVQLDRLVKLRNILLQKPNEYTAPEFSIPDELATKQVEDMTEEEITLLLREATSDGTHNKRPAKKKSH